MRRTLKSAVFRMLYDLLENGNLSESEIHTRIARDLNCDRRTVKAYAEEYADVLLDPTESKNFKEAQNCAMDRLTALYQVCLRNAGEGGRDALRWAQLGRKVLEDLHRIQGLMQAKKAQKPLLANSATQQDEAQEIEVPVDFTAMSNEELMELALADG